MGLVPALLWMVELVWNNGITSMNEARPSKAANFVRPAPSNVVRWQQQPCCRCLPLQEQVVLVLIIGLWELSSATAATAATAVSHFIGDGGGGFVLTRPSTSPSALPHRAVCLSLSRGPCFLAWFCLVGATIVAAKVSV